jgi:hypothetical protein
MTQRLPRFLITPSMAADVFRTYDLHLDIGTVRRWLLRHCREIEREFRYIPEQLIEDVVLNVCSQEWPDPAFDRMYKQVHRALDQATVEYVEEHHLDGDASCWSEAEYCDIVHGLLSHCAPKPLIRHLAVRMTFGKPPEVPFEGDPYFFEVTYAQGRVTATLKTAAPVSMVFN